MPWVFCLFLFSIHWFEGYTSLNLIERSKIGKDQENRRYKISQGP